jgi:hypothetical protein
MGHDAESRGAPEGSPSTKVASNADCFTCRVTGAVTFACCSAYLANEYIKVPKVNMGHRAALAGMAGFFGTLSIWRALW